MDFAGWVDSNTVWLRYLSEVHSLRGRESTKSKERLGRGSERIPSVLLLFHYAT